MDDLSQLSVVITLLIEVCCLTYFEYKAWQTIYTPLCALMLPYVAVLLITIAIAGDYGFVSFYYDSIYVWIYGLPLFALPSYACAAIMQYCGHPVITPIKEEEHSLSPVLIIVAVLLVVLLFYKLEQTIAHGFFLLGTDDFAEEFSGHGIWAHLREMLMPLIILALFYVRKRQYWLWLLIALMLIIQLTYMVKGAIIIALASALFMKLYTGKMRMNIMLILSIIGAAILVFIIIYMVLPLMGKESGEVNMELIEFIGRHFVHYFTSGTLGWSYDLSVDIPDRNDFSYALTPFVNITNALSGEELLSPVNKFYWSTGTTAALTNVRTFFGTLAVYSNSLEFVTYTIMASIVIYTLRIIAVVTRSIYINTIHFYFCGLMAMGWFEFYLFHLSVIEVPLIILLYAEMSRWKLFSSKGILTVKKKKEVGLG